MSLKKYEAFVRTVELGSLTKAAQSLGSTQSRISHILHELEPGDFIVHVDLGIGKFGGLVRVPSVARILSIMR